MESGAGEASIEARATGADASGADGESERASPEWHAGMGVVTGTPGMVTLTVGALTRSTPAARRTPTRVDP